MEAIKRRMSTGQRKKKHTFGLTVWLRNAEKARTALLCSLPSKYSPQGYDKLTKETHTKMKKLSVLFSLNRVVLHGPTQVASCKKHHRECLTWRSATACAPVCMPVISAWSWSCRHMDSWLRAAGPHESHYHNILLYHQQVCTLHS